MTLLHVVLGSSGLFILQTILWSLRESVVLLLVIPSSRAVTSDVAVVPLSSGHLLYAPLLGA